METSKTSQNTPSNPFPTDSFHSIASSMDPYFTRCIPLHFLFKSSRHTLQQGRSSRDDNIVHQCWTDIGITSGEGRANHVGQRECRRDVEGGWIWCEESCCGFISWVSMDGT